MVKIHYIEVCKQQINGNFHKKQFNLTFNNLPQFGDGPLNFNVNDGTIIRNLFVPSARTTNYGLKQLRVLTFIGYGILYQIKLKMLLPSIYLRALKRKIE